MNKKNYTRAGLVLSVVLMILWSLIGTGTSLAWFTDTDQGVTNVFHFANFEVEAEYRTADGTWKSIEGESKIFDDQALYEPGYVQVVYLRVTNKGDVPFDYQTAVRDVACTPATNVFGQTFYLQNYLQFGLTEAVQTEEQMDALVQTRDLARSYATMPLGTYEKDIASLDAGETVYMALVVQMPQEVDNVANYRGDEVPKVELGLIVTATQQKN